MTTTPIDGRRARALRTRENILSALLALLDEGRAAPTAAEIAARAGVAVRSIAQHFPTREHLLLAVAERHAARLAPAPRPEPERSFEERLLSFVSSRARALEDSASIRHAAMLGASDSKAVSAALDEVARRRRLELRASFAPELARAAPALRAAAEALASGPAWDELRHGQGLSLAVARRAVADGLRRLLGA